MTRPIKFRAWDKDSKRIVPFEAIILKDGQFKVGVWNYEETEVVEEHDFVLMQFTGLTDNNGKEIYEGDIVRYDNGLESCTPELIKWSQGGGCWVKGDGNWDDDGFTISRAEKVEVIGNIYENPSN